MRMPTDRARSLRSRSDQQLTDTNRSPINQYTTPVFAMIRHSGTAERPFLFEIRVNRRSITNDRESPEWSSLVTGANRDDRLLDCGWLLCVRSELMCIVIHRIVGSFCYCLLSLDVCPLPVEKSRSSDRVNRNQVYTLNDHYKSLDTIHCY